MQDFVNYPEIDNMYAYYKNFLEKWENNVKKFPENCYLIYTEEIISFVATILLNIRKFLNVECSAANFIEDFNWFKELVNFKPKIKDEIYYTIEKILYK